MKAEPRSSFPGSRDRSTMTGLIRRNVSDEPDSALSPDGKLAAQPSALQPPTLISTHGKMANQWPSGGPLDLVD